MHHCRSTHPRSNQNPQTWRIPHPNPENRERCDHQHPADFAGEIQRAVMAMLVMVLPVPISINKAVPWLLASCPPKPRTVCRRKRTPPAGADRRRPNRHGRTRPFLHPSHLRFPPTAVPTASAFCQPLRYQADSGKYADHSSVVSASRSRVKAAIDFLSIDFTSI